MTRFAAPIAEQIWDMKYRFKGFDGTPVDVTVEDTWNRIAGALAEAEKPEVREYWQQKFYEALEDFKFLPAGRITSGAGTGRNVTMMNCYVLGTIPDSMPGIFSAVTDAALTMQQGGGIGHDFSTIRPRGAEVKGVGADASGPLSFMDVWDSMCRTVMSAGSRRGAMMATMRCDHPDIEAFIEAKRDPLKLRMFNLSVLVTDAFMQAVKDDADFDLVHSAPPPGESEMIDGKWLYRTVRARDLWDKIMRSTYGYAEPGVIFIDRINKMNPLRYLETIAATNPCGEQPLPPYGACLLGSINLTRFVKNPFQKGAKIDTMALKRIVHVAVRMMDNVIDVTNFPLPQQAEEARNKRRIGLGITGLADMLLMLGVTYGSAEAVKLTERICRMIAYHAYLASAKLAKEKGPFPLFDADEYVTQPYVQQFFHHDDEHPDYLEAAIATHGLRNSHLTSIAPTGTISLYAGNVSSGIEPVFAYHYTRKVLQPDGSKTEEQVEDFAYAMWRAHHAGNEFGNEVLPDYFVSAQTLDPAAHVRMQAAAQKWVDSSISKTINCPEDISFEDFKAVYELAYDLGCKGCTTYRPNDVTGSVLSVDKPAEKMVDRPVMRDDGGHAVEVESAPGMVSEPTLCEDEGCPHHGMPHICVNKSPTSEPAPVLATRADALHGQTYKLRWPGTDHALYVTINDDERGNPYEVFLNTKNPEHYAWMMALTRMISAVFRRGGDTSFVSEELKAVFDPRGGAWVKGKYVPSMIAAIGDIIQNHVSKPHNWQHVADAAMQAVRDTTGVSEGMMPKVGKPCPKCSSYNTKNESGCFQCLDCGDSKCG